jgi:SAM-dependent methyltransferase
MDLLIALDRSFPVLDLACGKGRNGLMVAEQGLHVLFVDKSETSLDVVQKQLAKRTLPGSTWQVDLEQQEKNPFSGKKFSAVLGFCYLHRPLFPLFKEAVIPGGLVVYETFTTGQRQFGRPNNPDFLLQPGELAALFDDWEIIFQFEGVAKDPDRCIAQVVARKPARQ